MRLQANCLRQMTVIKMMKSSRKFILLVFFICCVTAIKAQLSVKTDTLYYFLDIEKTPINDRLIATYAEAEYIHYIINCPCLKSNNKPSLRGNAKRKEPISKSEIQKINFIKLSELIDKIKIQAYKQFQQTHIIFLVEKQNNRFTKNRVFLDDEPNDSAIDIHIDSVRKNRKP